MSTSPSHSNADLQTPPLPIQRRAPRIWTVFVAIAAGLAVTVALQTIVVIALVAWGAAQGRPPDEIVKELPDFTGAPGGFILLALCGQIGFGLAAIVPALLPPVALRQRLGLVAARPSWIVYPVTMLGSIAPLGVGLGMAQMVAKVMPNAGDPNAAKLFQNMTPAWGVVFVLFIALAPGFCEELLFRGYVQRRLLARWRPLVAISVTSLLFAMMHIMPAAVLATLPLGFWLGIVAWRTGSIGPSIACHAFVNGSLNTLRMFFKFVELPESVRWVITAASLLIGTACFIMSCRLLWRLDAGPDVVSSSAEALEAKLETPLGSVTATPDIAPLA
ncbi:MAG: CPBP family intramembrane metalloprotease [Planctomycetes bacterium]|nr:CPBP family intramembrane metalloprotease [Planctomycetota bacterium]